MSSCAADDFLSYPKLCPLIKSRDHLFCYLFSNALIVGRAKEEFVGFGVGLVLLFCKSRAWEILGSLGVNKQKVLLTLLPFYLICFIGLLFGSFIIIFV